MTKLNHHTKMKEAEQQLKVAKKEIQHPEKDFAIYKACQSSRLALSNYFTAFLFQNGIEPKPADNIEQLHRQCIKLDARFSQLDLSKMNCRHEVDDGHDEYDPQYCLDETRVKNCIRLASQAGEMVMKMA